MRPEAIDLMLRKQRLQWRAAQQRQACVEMLDEIDSGLSNLGRLQDGLSALRALLRRHALGLSLAGAALMVWRPRGIVRWLRRGWLVYWGAKRLRGSLGAVSTALRGFFSV